MSETRKIWKLSQINRSIKIAIEDRVGKKEFWVRAEISSFNIAQSGHAYLELVEHEGSHVLAKTRCSIWRDSLTNIKNELGSEFNNVVQKGSEILCQLSIGFHLEYGLSMTISAIDLSFSLGSLEKKRKETIVRLKKEGLLEKQLELSLPRVVQRIAIIGAPGTSGYEDFLKQTDHNEWGYHFQSIPFQSSVQGVKAEKEIVSRLKETVSQGFDAVILIRGGGSKLDLAVFDSYSVAQAIASHDTPIITGIGHETDLSVADMVAYTHTKTPSAAGAFLVELMITFDTAVEQSYDRIRNRFEQIILDRNKSLKLAMANYENRSISYTQLRRGELKDQGTRITRASQSRLESEKLTLKKGVQVISTRPHVITGMRRSAVIVGKTRLEPIPSKKLQISSHALDIVARKIRALSEEEIADQLHELKTKKLIIESALKAIFKGKMGDIESFQTLLRHVHPEASLKRGFSIIRLNDQVVDDSTVLKKGDHLEVEIYKKKFIVEFIETEKEWKKLQRSVTKLLQKN